MPTTMPIPTTNLVAGTGAGIIQILPSPSRTGGPENHRDYIQIAAGRRRVGAAFGAGGAGGVAGERR